MGTVGRIDQQRSPAEEAQTPGVGDGCEGAVRIRFMANFELNVAVHGPDLSFGAGPGLQGGEIARDLWPRRTGDEASSGQSGKDHRDPDNRIHNSLL